MPERRFAVDERDRGAMGHGDALGRARRAGREDDPRVVVGAGATGAARPGAAPRQLQRVAHHRAHAGIREDLLRSCGGVVGVHGDVRGTGGEHAEDRHVEVGGPAWDAHAHPVTRADAAVA